MVEALLKLNNVELRRLVKAVLLRDTGEEVPKLVGAEKYLFPIIREIKIIQVDEE